MIVTRDAIIATKFPGKLRRWRDQSIGLRITECQIDSGSQLIGESLQSTERIGAGGVVIVAIKKPDGGRAIDGLRAHQFHLVPSELERKLPHEIRVRRDELELKAAALREHKADLGTEAYYRQLEPMLLELARLYQTAR